MAKDLLEPTFGKIVTPLGYDDVDFHPIHVDANGDPQVDLLSILDGEIRNYVWDALVWRKQRAGVDGITYMNVHQLRAHSDVIPMHYHSQWRKRFSHVVNVGQDYVNSTPVAPGYVAVVTNLNMWTNNAGTTVIVTAVRDNVDTTFVYRDGAPAANVPYSWTGMIYLDAGDYIRADPTNCPIGGTVYLDVSAYLMRIP